MNNSCLSYVKFFRSLLAGWALMVCLNACQIDPAPGQVYPAGASNGEDPGAVSIRDSLSVEELQWLESHPVVTVAQDPLWPPVEFADRRGNPSGISNDYLTRIESMLGITFERVKHLNWQESYSRLKRWDIDMTTSVAVTPERSDFWAFTAPYMEIPIVILTRMDVPFIQDMGELDGKNIAVVEGYASIEWISRDFPSINLVKVPSVEAGLDLLQKGSVFGFVDNMLVAGYYLTKGKMYNLKIAGTTPYVNAQCMAVRKDWPILAGILQKALDAIQETERDSIYSRWVPVRYEYGFDYRLLRRAIIVFVAVLVFCVFWILILSVEIRRRKRSERALKINEGRLRTSIQTIPDLVWLKDKDGVFLFCNKTFERLFNAKESEIVGKTDFDFLDRERAEFFRERDASAVEAGIPVANEEWAVFADDGHRAFLDTVKTPMYDENHALVGVLGIARDISERKAAEEKIQNLLREKELLLSEVHHRIKNNMNTMRSLLTLQLNVEKDAAVAASLHDAENRIQSMMLLYDRLYTTDNYSELSVKDYLEPLAKEIVATFPNNGIVRIQTDIDDFVLNLNVLTPIGIDRKSVV